MYSQTCFKQPPWRNLKCGRIRQVAVNSSLHTESCKTINKHKCIKRRVLLLLQIYLRMLFYMFYTLFILHLCINKKFMAFFVKLVLWHLFDEIPRHWTVEPPQQNSFISSFPGLYIRRCFRTFRVYIDFIFFSTRVLTLKMLLFRVFQT